MKTSPVEVSPLMQELSAYIASAIKKPLPAEVTERAKVHLVDTFAAMISGSRSLQARKAVAYVKAQGGRSDASVIGTRIVIPAPNAALANGMCAHADLVDDSHASSRTHPGSSIVPAALAVAERQQLSGNLMLRAIVLGYDICVRLMLALKPDPLWSAGHYTLTFGGSFGAAAAAGALLGFDAQRMRFLLSYAAQQASGLYTVLRDPHHIEKAYVSAGMPAHNGVAAALMVLHGFTGVEDVFSGERNFFFTFSPDAEPAQLTRGLGRDYEILRTSIKRWPTGSPTQGPLHLLHELIQQHGLKASDVERLVVRMPDKELRVVNDAKKPNLCIQYLLAVMIVDGILTSKSAHDYARMKDPKILAMRKRVKAVGDPGLTDALLRRWRGVMEITLQDGRKLTHETMEAKGGFGNSLSRQEEEQKAFGLIAPTLSKRRAQALIATLWNFERLKNVRALRQFVSA